MLVHVCNGSGIFAYYKADVVSMQDYYPFGMLMPSRQYSSPSFRFGYQGSEKDDEITGVAGANITTLFREGDTRLAKWWGVDPKSNAYESPFAFMGNNPIRCTDIYGDVVKYKADADEKLTKKYTEKTVINKRGKEVKNKNYNEKFANIIADLDSKTEVYEIGKVDAKPGVNGNKEAGSFTYSDGIFHINYSDGSSPEDGDNEANILFHETYHAKQFTEGKNWFEFNEESKTFDPHGNDIFDELAALKFGTEAGYKASYKKDGYDVETRDAIILRSTTSQAIKYLTEGITLDVHKMDTDANGQPVMVYGKAPVYGAYCGYSTKEHKSDAKQRTFNGNIVVYPYK